MIKKPYWVFAILVILGLVLLLIASCSTEESRPSTRDDKPISDEEFLAELESIYDETVEQLQNLYWPSLQSSTHEIPIEEFPYEIGDEEWAQHYYDKSNSAFILEYTYYNAQIELDDLWPSDEFLDEFITLCFLVETYKHFAYYEMAIYNLCLEEGLTKDEWSLNQSNPEYKTYQDLVRSRDDAINSIEEEYTSILWDEMLEKFNFIDVELLFPTLPIQ